MFAAKTLIEIRNHGGFDLAWERNPDSKMNLNARNVPRVRDLLAQVVVAKASSAVHWVRWQQGYHRA